jgi:hypothetical protein
MTTWLSGGTALADYYPDHENGNVLSYPAVPPTDILANLVAGNQLATTMTDNFTAEYSWTAQNIDTTQTSSKFDINGSIEAGTPARFKAFGISGKLKGDYSQQSISSSSTDFDQSASIAFNLNALGTSALPSGYGQPNQWPYNVKFNLYNSTGTYQISNYQVNPSLGGQYMWSNQYAQPDFALTLPYRYSDFNQQFTTDLSIVAPQTPTIGSPVTLQATLHNHSVTAYTGSDPVTVSFYNSDPNGQRQASPFGSKTVSAIPGQGSVTVDLQYTPSANANKVWAILTPPNGVTEVHQDNNTGYFSYTAFDAPDASAAKAKDDPVPPAFFGPKGAMRLSPVGAGPADLVTASGRGSPGPGRGADRSFRLEVELQALGADFGEVPVTFYDGDPRQGGRYIGHTVVPLVYHDHRTSVAHDWRFGRLGGRHTVFAKVGHLSAWESDTRNNMHSFEVDLGAPSFEVWLPYAARP